MNYLSTYRILFIYFELITRMHIFRGHDEPLESTHRRSHYRTATTE